MQIEVTRYRVLRECLDMVEARLRVFGHNGSTVRAAAGYEVAFETEQKKAEILRQMMREARYGVQCTADAAGGDDRDGHGGHDGDAGGG